MSHATSPKSVTKQHTAARSSSSHVHLQTQNASGATPVHVTAHKEHAAVTNQLNSISIQSSMEIEGGAQGGSHANERTNAVVVEKSMKYGRGVEWDRVQDRSRSRGKERDGGCDKGIARERERERDENKERDKDRETHREMDSDRDRDREGYRGRDREKNRERDIDRESDRKRHREREKDRDIQQDRGGDGDRTEKRSTGMEAVLLAIASGESGRERERRGEVRRGEESRGEFEPGGIFIRFAEDTPPQVTKHELEGCLN